MGAVTGKVQAPGELRTITPEEVIGKRFNSHAVPLTDIVFKIQLVEGLHHKK